MDILEDSQQFYIKFVFNSSVIMGENNPFLPILVLDNFLESDEGGSVWYSMEIPGEKSCYLCFVHTVDYIQVCGRYSFG